MSNVHILPPDIIAKIAAGEVIERPASVVKELLENAIDAGADDISLRLLDAGKKLIAIKDNGSGIAREDLENIFLRHATSKISQAEDLFDIQSLGFRGEALYSVAAIADIVLKSMTKNADEAWEIHLRGGEKLNLAPCALGQSGTEIEIQELFYNTPARKKFLKSNAAEITQILNIVIPYTILHPDIRFKLTHQNKDIIHLSPTSDKISRLAETLNLETKHLMTASREYPGDLKIELLLGNINIKRSRRDLQHIFVNGRPVDNKNISYNMNDVYRLIMAPQEFPCFAVNIQIPAAEVDANIHPTKREVKIQNERQLCSLLRRLTEDTLMSQGAVKTVDFQKPSIQKQSDWPSAASAPSRPSPGIDQAPSSSPNIKDALHVAEKLYSTESLFAAPDVSQEQTPSLSAKFENADYIGQFMYKFLLFEAGPSLLIVDQHAAQERIMFEYFIKQMDQGDLQVQNLLSPVLISLSPQELTAWEERSELLQECGFDNNQWDPTTIAVHTHPSLIYDVEKSVRGILAGDAFAKNDHATLALRACKASIRAGDKLSREQALNQREELLNCNDPYTCPHGRPTVIEFTENFLDKQFLRT